MTPSRGRVNFRVLDAVTGEPVPEFSGYLLANGWTVYENGTASASAPPEKRHTEFRAEGYFDTGRFDVTPFPGKTADREIFVNPKGPAGRINVRCVDITSGEIVKNAVLSPRGEKPLSAPSGSAVIPAEANFKNQWVAAAAPGYKKEEGAGYFTAGRKDGTLVIPMIPEIPDGRGNLLAAASDGENPLPGADMTLTFSGKQVRGRTNNSGQVLFRNVPAGVHTLSGSLKGYGNRGAKIAVENGDTAKLTLELEPVSAIRPLKPFEPIIVSGLSGAALRPGKLKTLTALIANRGDAGGTVLCTLDLPDIGKIASDVFLGPGERKEVPFEVRPPEDFIGAPVHGLLKVGDQTRRETVEVKAPVFSMRAETDREAYEEGDSMTVKITVESDEGEGDYQVRLNYNDEARVGNVVLESGSGSVIFDGLPVSFRGNKLLYGLYHESGRSILIDAIPVRDLSEGVLMIPDKQQYSAGDTVRLKIRGGEEEKPVLYSVLLPGGAPGREGKAETSPDGEGIASIEIPLPKKLATGSYIFRCGNSAVTVDVRGIEVKVLDRRLEEDGDGEELLLWWKAEGTEEVSCRWSAEVHPAGEEPYVADEGTVTLAKGRGEYMVRVEPDDDEPCNLLLRLDGDYLSPAGEPLAVIRYSREGSGE